MGGWGKAKDTVRNAAEDAVVADNKAKAAEEQAQQRDEQRRAEESK